MYREKGAYLLDVTIETKNFESLFCKCNTFLYTSHIWNESKRIKYYAKINGVIICSSPSKINSVSAETAANLHNK